MLEIITDHIGEIIAALLGGSFIIQISPINFNPWSWILKKIGNLINSELNEKIEEISAKVDALDERVKGHEDVREKDKAENARRRILRFSDECIRGMKHSKEYTDNVLEDISFYKQYCAEHPGFKNEKCVLSIEVIEKDFKVRVENNDFL